MSEGRERRWEARGTGTVAVLMERGAVRRLLAAALALGGYAVRLAGSGAEALGPARGERPDLILLDASMRGPAGPGALRRILARDPGTRVVAFAARPTVEMARRARDLGAREFVGEPFDLRTLLRVVADNLRPAAGRDRFARQPGGSRNAAGR